MTARRGDRGSPTWLRVTLVGLTLFTVFLATANFSKDDQNVDTQATAIAAWRLATHWDTDLSGFEGFQWIDPLPDGRTVANRFGGVVLSTSPFYVVMGDESGPTVFPGAIAAAFWTTIAMVTLFLALSKVTTAAAAAWATALMSFGTATWTVSADQPWTHGPAQFGMAVGLLGLASERWFLSGLGMGISVAHRAQLAVAPLLIGLLEGWRRRSLRPVLGIGAGSMLGLVVLLTYNRLVFGSWSPFGGYQAYSSRVTSPTDPGVLSGLPEAVLGTLVSPQRGVFVLMPFLIVLLPGLLSAWRAAPGWVRSAAIAAVGVVVAQLWVNYFTGGYYFYGSRVTLESLTLAAPLLLLSWTTWASRTRIRRVAFVITAGYAVVTHALAAVASWTPPTRSAWDGFMLLDAIYASPVWRVALILSVGVVGTGFAVRWACQSPESVESEKATKSDNLALP